MLFILLPAYNEGKDLRTLLEKIVQLKRILPYDFKIIIVNDGSTDDTEEVALFFKALLPIEVFSHEKNRGLGEALKSGLKKILPNLGKEDMVVTLDADNTHPPELIPEMVEKIVQGHHLVIASRFCPGGKEIGLKFSRKIFSRAAGFLLKLFFPFPGVNDYTSGYRAYKGHLLLQANNFYKEKLVESRGFTCMAELLIKLQKFNPQITEVSLILRYDLKKSKSKIKIIKTIIQYFHLIWRLKFDLNYKQSTINNQRV